MIRKLQEPFEPFDCAGVRVLGHRSYWLESRAATLKETLATPVVPKPVLEARNIDKIAPVKISSRYLRHPLPQNKRKEKFLEMLKAQKDL